MPALTMSHRPKNGAEKPPFELPALNLDFGKITDGTNIPPPLPSPKVPTPPQTPPTIDAKDAQAHGTADANKTNGFSTGTFCPKYTAPLSPTPFVQQGTLQRMLSKRIVNNTTAESRLPPSHSAPLLDNVDRPQSRGGFSLMMGDRKSKRNSGWFKRFRSGDPPPSSRRSSFLFGGSSSNLPDISKPLDPPPPMIPELRELEKEEGSLGSDIFRNIK